MHTTQHATHAAPRRRYNSTSDRYSSSPPRPNAPPSTVRSRGRAPRCSPRAACSSQICAKSTPLPKASVALLLAAGCRARWHRSSAVPTTSPCAAANPFSRLVRLHAALGVAAGYRHCTVCAATGTIYRLTARVEIGAQHYALRNVCACARASACTCVCLCVRARARVCAGGTAHPAPCRPVRLRPSAV